MLVLIPNPNQMSQLVQLQKDFIKNANVPAISDSTAPIFYQASPLWIFLPEDKFLLSGNEKKIKDELKELSKLILQVELEEPRLYFSEECQQLVLGCHSRISTPKEVCTAELILCKTASAASAASDVMKTPTSEIAEHLPDKCPAFVHGLSEIQFPLRLKIFRLAVAVRPNENSLAVSDFVWEKIKKES